MSDHKESGYNLLAPFYDDLAGLVFGQPLFSAQLYSIQQVSPTGSVLILGGGTGWILPFMYRHAPQLEIYFVDLSARMIVLAARKAAPHQKVHFIHGTEKDLPDGIFFDQVLLNFYVDGFAEEDLPQRLTTIGKCLRPQSPWIVTDFTDTGKLSHRWLLALTHRFFRCMVQHPNKRLLNWQNVFTREGFYPVSEKFFANGLIKNKVYRK